MHGDLDTIVMGIGELLWDVFPDGRRPGGAPANVAWHASQLGHRGLVVSRVGADEAGAALRRELDGRGLDLAYLQDDPYRPTGTVDVDTSDPHAPRFTIHEDVAWDAIHFDEALRGLAARAAAVCFGTLAQRSAVSRDTIHGVLAAATSALKVYDVNLRQHFHDRAWIEPSLRAADVVKLNADEVVTLAGLLGASSTAPVDLARLLRDAHGVGVVCVTRGAAGCLVVGGEEVVDVPGTPVEVADAVGAGDAFTAAFIAGRLRGLDLGRTARLANAVGGLVASRPGAMPELREELADLLDEAMTGGA